MLTLPNYTGDPGLVSLGISSCVLTFLVTLYKTWHSFHCWGLGITTWHTLKLSFSARYAAWIENCWVKKKKHIELYVQVWCFTVGAPIQTAWRRQFSSWYKAHLRPSHVIYTSPTMGNCDSSKYRLFGATLDDCILTGEKLGPLWMNMISLGNKVYIYVYTCHMGTRYLWGFAH